MVTEDGASATPTGLPCLGGSLAMSKSNMSSRGSIVGFTGVLGGDDKSDENDEDDESLVDFDDGGVAWVDGSTSAAEGDVDKPFWLLCDRRRRGCFFKCLLARLASSSAFWRSRNSTFSFFSASDARFRPMSWNSRALCSGETSTSTSGSPRRLASARCVVWKKVNARGFVCLSLAAYSSAAADSAADPNLRP